MEFKRARNSTQKGLRLEEIIQAALRQYERMPYDKISLASISKDLPFSRANLYKYYRTKEDIFLRVIDHDFEVWVSDIRKAFGKKMELRKFSEQYSKLMLKNKRLLELFSILTSTIERNSSLKNLIDFKKSMSLHTKNVYLVLALQFPAMTPDSISRLLSILMHYAVGLYPSTNSNKLQDKSVLASGTKYKRPDFVEDYTEFIVFIVKGMEQIKAKQ